LLHDTPPYASEIDKIVEIAHAHGIKIIEDCSQSHFAKHKAKPVGTFGDIAAFSTMYRKRRTWLGRRAGSSTRAISRFSATHWSMPIMASCAGGTTSTIEILQRISPRRSTITPMRSRAPSAWRRLSACPPPSWAGLPSSPTSWRGLYDASDVCRGYRFMPTSSPFYFPVIVDVDVISCSKIEFAEAVRAEGIDLNPHYKYVVCEWHYIQPAASGRWFRYAECTQHSRSLVQPLSQRKLSRAAETPSSKGPIYSARLQCSNKAGQSPKKVANPIIRPGDTNEISLGPAFDSLKPYQRCSASGEARRP
jgi:DegT/DnrJ/EryC1/StrS aminotransferase family